MIGAGYAESWESGDCSNPNLKRAVHAFNTSPASAIAEYGPIANWDVSAVSDMSGLFSYSNFNADISNWDTSGVTDMSYMFYVRCGPPPGTTPHSS